MCKVLDEALETHTGVMPGPCRTGCFPVCLRGRNAATGDDAGGDGSSS